MRLKRQPLIVRSGSVVICDPELIRDVESDDAAVFRLWEGNGEFIVYACDDMYFIDVDPRIFKAKARPGLQAIPGRVRIDSSHIGVYDLTEDRRKAADDALAEGRAVAIHGLANGPYVAWFEEKGTSKQIFRGVIGFGSQPMMVLNGDHATQLQELEDRIAVAYRLKGPDKQQELQTIAEFLCELHLDGCQDKRLRMMADSIKLALPRRTPKRN